MQACYHSQLYWVRHHNHPSITFCGLCFLAAFFRAELPGRLHEHRTLADNGNPQMDNRFVAHLEASLGLIPPRKGQNLVAYRRNRLARGQKEPPRSLFPVTNALWRLMGYQPPLAKPLVHLLCGRSELDIAAELGITPAALQFTLAKGVRTTMRLMRN